MKVVRTIAELETAPGTGLVPTMGALHGGHRALFRAARAESERVVASLFVNPAQFDQPADLEAYPRDEEHDLEIAEAEGVDIVFAPTPEELYPAGFATWVEPQETGAEGASRPGHFRGVATVCLKLFNLVHPERAYFGQKDAQQVAVLRRMVADLNVPVALRVCPTVREADGLALSSRNAYLGPEDRAAAVVLSRALLAGVAAFDARPEGGVEAVRQAMAAVAAGEPLAELEYADVCNPDTFAPLTDLTAPTLLAIAARVGPARLIDNVVLRPGAGWDLGVRLAQEDAEQV